MTMQDGTVGRRYARALGLALQGAPEDRLTRIEEQLSAVGAALDRRTGDQSLRQAMFNPTFSAGQRKDVLGGIAKAHDFDATALTFLQLLVDKNRLASLPTIAAAFRAEVDARIGRVRAVIVTAKALDTRDLAAIVAGLEKKTGKRVVPDVQVDPSIIAGVQARIGGLVYDATVKAQLERLRSEFNIQ
jgi:F-type H+-transporting ATPase subunit delta